ncbi:MAG: DUF1330 domain-containing protein, partial [Pseudomonadales bacterium]|nr:DUF1330 domain-containing protein [Pseudomonadales bacterium]
MEVKNSVVPNDRQIKGFFEPGAPGPIYMVNLLKFKEKAEYADGRETQLTGAEAYKLYSVAVSNLLQEFGGDGAFFADIERLVLGEVEELWDQVAIAVYPSRAAMLEMMQSPTMKDISQHREAGLAGQLNIETTAAQGTWLD